MSEEITDYPYTWEASQNAKGSFQLRVKVKSFTAENPDAAAIVIAQNLKSLKEKIEAEGFTVQSTEVIKEKKEKKA